MQISSTPVDCAAEAALTPAQQLVGFPAQRLEAAHHTIAYREAGAGHREAMPVVLLHGIGSGSASWVAQLEALGQTRRVLAWDAPGYGASTPVARVSPQAADYAAVLGAWLDALGVADCVLVGHSLGAIMAGAYAAAQSSRVKGLLLLSPAGGYGAATVEVRQAKRDARLAMLDELGADGLAQARIGKMLSAYADEAAHAWVRWNMARVIPAGYRQATHLLANADLTADLSTYRGRIAVAVGADDAITSPAACERIAKAAEVELQIVPRAGHAAYVEAPAAYSRLIDSFCRTIDESGVIE